MLEAARSQSQPILINEIEEYVGEKAPEEHIMKGGASISQLEHQPSLTKVNFQSVQEMQISHIR
jgi:hypothetical protein